MNAVEIISWNGSPLTYIIREELLPNQTTFITPPEFKQQVGFVVYRSGGEVARHVHKPLQRQLVGTSEVLILRKGRCIMDVYNNDRALVASKELREGDIMLMVDGGHGFRMLDDTVFLEVKQGPYTGIDEKERFESRHRMIPVNEPLIGDRELEYVTECLRTGWISSAGRFIEEFERSWAAYCGMKYGVAVSNGTTALQIALKSLELSPGDEVIMPTFTIISCALAVVECGAIPVLVDSDPRTWCMDISQIEAKLTSRTKAIMPVHIYGHPVDMDPILEFARKNNLKVIEDAAEAHGAEYMSRLGLKVPAWKRCGGMGDVSCFSFYANKLITTGEGGMVLTNDPELAEKARSLRNLCFRPERRFYHTELGYNFRFTNVQAAMGLAQLERFDKILEKKRWMGKQYSERLADLKMFRLPVEESWAWQVYWMFGLVLDENTGMDAVEFARRLKDRGVDTRPFFLGMHEQPVFGERGLFIGENHPVAERIARQGLYLPSGLALTEEQLETVSKTVREVLS